MDTPKICFSCSKRQDSLRVNPSRNVLSSIMQFSVPPDVINLWGKFEFENIAIMEDKLCKQMERFLAIAKESDNFLSLDDNSKRIYKVKINNMQGYDPDQIKEGRNFRRC